MRTVFKVACGLILVVVAFSQALPVGLGFGTTVGVPGMTNYLDWYAATASGCTAGTNGKCVGNFPQGDTPYCAWLSSASGLPITGGIPVVCTLNDFTWTTSSIGGNLMLFQFDTFSWATPNASRMTLVNAMTSYGTNGGDTNVPAGWFGHCTSGDDGSQGCSWKSRNPIEVGGCIYLPVERQIPAGTDSVHDATFVKSCDSGQTWQNPYTVAHSGSPSATGDAPVCGAANGSIGSNCTDTPYLDGTHSSVMWKALPNTIFACGPIEYGQAGTTMPTPPDGTDPATYLYCMATGGPNPSGTGIYSDGSIWRVPVASIMDISAWRYYTCPTITESYRCPMSASASWTATFADRTSVFSTWVWGIKYLPEFKSYLATGAQGMFFAPSLAGPWTLAQSNFETFSVNQTFMNPVPALGYTVLSGYPNPHLKITMVSDRTDHSAQRSPVVSEWEFTLGHNVQGAQPIYRKGFNPYMYNGYYSIFSGIQLSDSHGIRSIPRNGLVAAWDMYDYGGATLTGGQGGFRDGANSNAFLLPVASGINGWNSGQGLQLAATGPSLNGASGYAVYLKTVTNSFPPAVGGAYTDRAMGEMAGNASWTVATVFQRNTPTDAALDTVPIWEVGDTTGGNTALSLSYPKGTGSVELGWGEGPYVSHYGYATGWVPTSGNWYFAAATVTANGSTPTSHLWVGVGGVLVDKLAGISRAATGGSGTPSATPNVTSSAMILGLDPAQSVSSINAAYGGTYVYSRALSRAEVGRLYSTMKTVMAARGVSLQ